MRLIPKRTTDKNGRNTTVYVRPSTTVKKRILPPIGEREKAARERNLREEQKRLALHAEIVQDLEKNLKPRINKDGTTTVSVFRSGVPNPPSQRGAESESYAIADALRPSDGRSGRSRGVFAAPSLGGVARWTLGYSDDQKVRELRVDADSTYVYKIRDWEVASSAQQNGEEGGSGMAYLGLGQGYISTEDAFRRYWDGGMTVREWTERARNDDSLDPSEWEILVSEDDIQMVKPVSTERVVAGVYENYHVSKSSVERALNGKWH